MFSRPLIPNVPLACQSLVVRGMHLILTLGLAASGISGAMAADKPGELDPAHVASIERLLPEQPAGFGNPITDRAFWENARTKALVAGPAAEAAKLLAKPFPAWDDALYLDFSKSGQRLPGEKMLRARDGWLAPLVLAECLENQGRYLPRIQDVLLEYVKQPTWTLPAHDRALTNFRRTKYEVDLAAAAQAAQLAECIYLLAGKLDPQVRAAVLAALEQRIFAPVRASLRTGRGHWWLGDKAHPVQNNWNAVCLAGVVGAACSVLPERKDRALFVAAGEHYAKYFINGFRDDGYCDEGYGYWVYGFSNYVVLREILRSASGGEIELFAQPKVVAIAMYGARAVMGDMLVPNFADCRSGKQADCAWVGYCNHVLHLGLDNFPLQEPPGGKSLQTIFMPASPLAGAKGAPGTALGLRSYFDQAGVLVCRPAPQAAGAMGMAIKAGGNSSHSHNDIGSFVISLNGELAVGDPGGPHAYNSETFGPKRYTYKLLNSFGHPVPVVGGMLQSDATRLQPKVLATRFSDVSDEIEIDMGPAYAVPGLRELTRRVRFERGGRGQVVVEDRMQADSPLAFEIALPTPGACKQLDERRLEFRTGKAVLVASVEAPDGFVMTDEVISELNAPPFHRIGLKLRKPVRKAAVRVTFNPQPPAAP